MLPTFVIGLREGLEAALIVGIIAAFLKQEGRQDRLRAVWIGVATAIVICLGVGIGLHAAEQALPQKEQEGLETVIGLIAVGFVSWMILWMRKHARTMKHELEAHALSALAAGSASALVIMAFLAVFREGFETSVFLLAAFQNSANPTAAGTGAILGLAVAIVIGIGIYRGGVRLDLARFFKFTGVVLVLVAAGLLATAMHTAHEAGWINFLQHEVMNLTWLVEPGSVRAALLTGMFGIWPKPTVIEVVAWVGYALPFLWLVLAPRRVPSRPAPVPVTSAA